MTCFRISTKSPPVDNSIRVSAPASSACFAFSISSGILTISVEVPIDAFTLVRRPSPIPQIFTLRYGETGMTICPPATLRRTKSSVTPSCAATNFISSVTMPRLASATILIPYPLRQRPDKGLFFQFWTKSGLSCKQVKLIWNNAVFFEFVKTEAGR